MKIITIDNEEKLFLFEKEYLEQLFEHIATEGMCGMLELCEEDGIDEKILDQIQDFVIKNAKIVMQGYLEETFYKQLELGQSTIG